METEYDNQCLKRVLIHDTTALSIRDKQNLYCVEQFQQGGLRARRRYYECIPHYLSLLGKSLEGVREEMETFDWEKYKKEQQVHEGEAETDTEASSPGLYLSDIERKVMQLGFFATDLEVREHLTEVRALGDPDDFYHGRIYDMNGFELRQLMSEDGEDEEDSANPRFRSLRYLCENFVAVYGAMCLNWLPESKWGKAGQEEPKLKPTFGTSHEGAPDLSAISEGGESRVVSPENANSADGPLGSRLRQDLINALLERDPSRASNIPPEPSIKGKEVERLNPFVQSDGGRDIRYTRHAKSDMVYWQAEALFMAHLVQEKAERGLRQAYWIAEKMGWEEEIAAAEQECF